MPEDDAVVVFRRALLSQASKPTGHHERQNCKGQVKHPWSHATKVPKQGAESQVILAMWANRHATYDSVMDTQTLAIELADEALPRCFVLDEQDHIIMVCSAQLGLPINPRFAETTEKLTLPLVFQQAVSVLAERCVIERKSSHVARFGAYTLKVQLLRGSSKTHTAVIVDRAAA